MMTFLDLVFWCVVFSSEGYMFVFPRGSAHRGHNFEMSHPSIIGSGPGIHMSSTGRKSAKSSFTTFSDFSARSMQVLAADHDEVHVFHPIGFHLESGFL